MEKKYLLNSVFDKTGVLLPLSQRTFKTKESLGSYTITIIDGGSKPSYVTAQIEDYIFETTICGIRKGTVRYPLHPSVVGGKGYLGIGKHKATIDNAPSEVYKIWKRMLVRAYDPKYHERQPTYKDVTVHPDWHNFQIFAEWFYYESNYQEGWHLDKDLLSGESKVYSKSTCIFIPQALNNFMIGTPSTNTSGYLGVSWSKRRNKWLASIRIDNKLKQLGCFETKEEASETYKMARTIRVKEIQERYKDILPIEILRRLE